MTIKQTIEFIREELTITQNDYQAWFALEPELLAFKPREGWSIEQILEHVTLTSHYLLILIRKGKRKALELAAKKDWGPELAAYSNNLPELDAIAQHKSFAWVRPEHMEPQGDKSLNEVRALMDIQIQECQDVLIELSNGEGILYKTTMTVNQLGKIDVYQYIYFLCQHAKRHLSQMQKVKEEFNESFV